MRSGEGHQRHRALALICAAVAILLTAAGCSSSPPCPAGASCPLPIGPSPTYVVTVNRHAASFASGHAEHWYRVSPGEHLRMTVTVTLPKQLRLTNLWLGISAGTWGNGPGGQPTGIRPILAHARQLLPTGAHTFRLRWRVPAGQAGRTLYLTSAWSSHRPPGSVAGSIAILVVR